MKLLDIIKQMFRKQGIILRNPVKRKTSYAKPGQCKVIEPYDLEIDFKERVKENSQPHPYKPYED